MALHHLESNESAPYRHPTSISTLTRLYARAHELYKWLNERRDEWKQLQEEAGDSVEGDPSLPPRSTAETRAREYFADVMARLLFCLSLPPIVYPTQGQGENAICFYPHHSAQSLLEIAIAVSSHAAGQAKSQMGSKEKGNEMRLKEVSIPPQRWMHQAVRVERRG